MSITYVRLVYTKPTPDVFERRFEGLLEEDNILLVDPVLEATSKTIGDLYRETLARYLRRHDVVVFRGSGPDFVTKIAQDDVVKDFLPRLQGGALVGRATSMQGPVWAEIPGMSVPARVPPLESLRQAEMLGILRRTGAIFESDVYHYVLPYQERHAEKFIRLADALRSVYDIDRILDWLVETITGDTLVIGDTGSMLPLMLRLREHVEETTRFKVEVASLDKYPEDRVDVTARIRAITNRPFVTTAQLSERPLNYLFLISVSSSGRLCAFFHNLFRDSTIVVICRTRNDALPCNRYLATVDITNWPAEDCERCPSHPKIQVDPQTYELIPRLDWKPVIVGHRKATDKAKFWSMTSRTKAVDLHKTVKYSGTAPESERHFSVFLDTEKMAQDAWFRERCKNALLDLGKPEPPDLILIPQHSNSHVVESICREVYPSLIPLTVPAGKLEVRLHEPLQQARRIIIADDAIVTGNTMFNFRTAIYNVTQPAETKPMVGIFVMVSRTSDDSVLEAFNYRYRSPQHGLKIAYGEQIYLPEEQKCPWCKELEFLAEVVGLFPEESEEQQAVRDRIRHLEQKPLQWPFFMLHEGHGLTPDLRAVDSFFGTEEDPLNAYAAFAAGACVAQTMKKELGDLSRISKKPQQTKSGRGWKEWLAKLPLYSRFARAMRAFFRDPASGDGVEFKYADMNMVYSAYFETTLLSSLLRTFDAVEVMRPAVDDQFERKLEVADPARAYPGAVTELAYAAIQGKVPKRAIRSTLEKFKDSDRWFRMLLAIMNAVEAR